MWQAVATAEPDHVASLAYYPSSLREPAAVIMAFSTELRAIGSRTTEPALGDIRLAWWREAVIALFAAKASDAAAAPGASHPVLVAMARTLTANPSLEPALLSLVDAAEEGPESAASGHSRASVGGALDRGLAYALAQLCGADEPLAANIGTLGALYGSARHAGPDGASVPREGLVRDVKQGFAELSPFEPSLAPLLAALKSGIGQGEGKPFGPFRRRLSQFSTVLRGR